MKARKILLDVIRDLSEERDFRYNFEYFDFIKNNNFAYRLFRFLTTQKMRDIIYSFYSCLSRRRDDFFFERSNFSMNHYLDYLSYILFSDPVLPFKFFPKKDHESIVKFLRNIIVSCFLERIKCSYFDRDEWLEYSYARSVVVDSLSFKRGYFCFDSFLSRIPGEYSLISKNWYLDIFGKADFKIIIDAGAYIGDSSFVFNRYFRPERIYAIEPDNNNYKILRESLIVNKMKNVVPLKLALYKRNGYLNFESGNFLSSALTNNEKGNLVKVVTIDTLVENLNLKRLDFVKMDIEGSEFDALKGSVGVLRTFKPDLLIAVYHKGSHLFEMPAWLKENFPYYNFRFVAMNAASPVIERYIAASTRKI